MTSNQHLVTGWAGKLVRLVPLRESGYRLLMQAFASRGDRVEALADILADDVHCAAPS